MRILSMFIKQMMSQLLAKQKRKVFTFSDTSQLYRAKLIFLESGKVRQISRLLKVRTMVHDLSRYVRMIVRSPEMHPLLHFISYLIQNVLFQNVIF